MLNYKIIATDIDGTLLDDKHLLSLDNEKAIIAYIENGHYFVMNSGALPKDAKKILELTNIGINDLTKWFVGANGIVVYNFKTNESFVNITKNNQQIIEKTISAFPGVNYDIRTIKDQVFLHYIINDDKRWYDLMLELYRYLVDDANKIEGFKNLLLVMNNQEHTSFTLKDILYFGDNLNDIPVFDNKDVTSIAVANAIEPIKQKATDHTSDKVKGLADYLNK